MKKITLIFALFAFATSFGQRVEQRVPTLDRSSAAQQTTANNESTQSSTQSDALLTNYLQRINGSVESNPVVISRQTAPWQQPGFVFNQQENAEFTQGQPRNIVQTRTDVNRPVQSNIVMSHNVDNETLGGGTVACGNGAAGYTTENSWFRTYTPSDFGLTGDVQLEGLEFAYAYTDNGGSGVEETGLVRAWTSDDVFPAGNYTFTVNVSDGELDADLTINTSALSQILQELRFVGRYVGSSVNAQTITDPSGQSISVCASPVGTSGGHSCNRGSFKVFANGTPIGIINISNAGGGGYYAGSLANSATNPDYPHTLITDVGQPSGNEEYYYDNSINNNSPGSTDRYQVFQMSQATAEAIAQASGNGNISFTIECNTFTSASTQNTDCHSNALWFSIFRPGYGQYLCSAFSTSSLVTINAYTGNIVNPIP